VSADDRLLAVMNEPIFGSGCDFQARWGAVLRNRVRRRLRKSCAKSASLGSGYGGKIARPAAALQPSRPEKVVAAYEYGLGDAALCS